MNNLSQATSILSAMIAPVVLIMASGSLILTTSQRLSRVIERSRKLTDQLRQLVKENTSGNTLEKESQLLFSQLNMATQRARLLQRAMTSLYLTLSVFLTVSISIVIIDVSGFGYTWLPVALAITGAFLLFYASILLIKESRIAVWAVDEEMKQAILLFQTSFPDFPKEQELRWWEKILRKWLRKRGTIN